MKPDLVTFGETMIRLSTRPGDDLLTANSPDLHVGGAESNTACALSRLGMKTAWVSRLPDNPLGRRIEEEVRRHGVDTSHVIWPDRGRAGVYFVEFHAPPRAITVTYDRKDSAVARTKPGEIDYDFLTSGRVLHLTGITPALSSSCREAVSRAVKKARAKNVPISFDINYRSKLWKPAAAAKVLAPLITGSTILVMTDDDAKLLFKLSVDHERALREARHRFQAQVVALTLGGQGAMLFDGKQILHEPGLPAVEPIDRLGAGDAFTAGLLFGLLHQNLRQGLKYGIAMSAMKMGMQGDTFRASLSDVQDVLESRGGGVKR